MMLAESTIYSSDDFEVVVMVQVAPPTRAEGASRRRRIRAAEAIPPLTTDYFMILRKSDCQYVCLNGGWAELFQRHVTRWRLCTPHVDEVEKVLSSYCELAQIPLALH